MAIWRLEDASRRTVNSDAVIEILTFLRACVTRKSLGKRSVPHRKTQKQDPKPWRLLLWVAVAGLFFGFAGMGEPVEDVLRIARNRLHPHPASGDIVLVAIDDKALKQVGMWPWKRSEQARLFDSVNKANPERVFLDIIYDHRTDSAEDGALAAALARASGDTVLPYRHRSGAYRSSAGEQDGQPLDLFARHAQLASISLEYNYQNAAWRLPYAVSTDGEIRPSFAAMLAKTDGGPRSRFRVDYSLDPFSIPTVSAADVLTGQVPASMISGKTVVIGTMSEQIGDQYYIPGLGKMGGAVVHIVGAETLLRGKPVDLGWGVGLALALAAASIAVRRNTRRRGLVLASTFSGSLLLPLPLEANNIFVDITPGIFATAVVAAVLVWRHFRARGLVNPVSGLPNLSALRANRAGRDQALVVARINNYSEIAATLPPDSERQLVEQIVARLSVGTADRTLYQGDGGIFAWFEETQKPFGHHLEALYALFRNPVRAAGLSIDLPISFGVEIGSGRSLSNRLGSALVAAEVAAHQGLKWKHHDPESIEDASWKLSMLSQLDEAIDKGEVWIAFQPQLDLQTRNIVGAEALARWTHPEKGPIAASEFVAAAEQHDRIGKLTDYVLDQSVAAAAAINKRGHSFDVAVNLSARLLTDRQFVMRVNALLARHGLAAKHLALELTETAELLECGDSLDTLARLRELGVRISIDDYGTGLSTLDYLKKIPAHEIKIDQSFVKSLCDNRSDRLMVQSTIHLAHSLGRQVVAEGVEQRDVLEALTEMGCDFGQGFIIGRPMSLESLLKRISGERRRQTA